MYRQIHFFVSLLEADVFGCRMKKLHDLTKEKKNVIVLTVSKMDGRGCMCRKAAGEESPGFTGQDAG